MAAFYCMFSKEAIQLLDVHGYTNTGELHGGFYLEVLTRTRTYRNVHAPNRPKSYCWAEDLPAALLIQDEEALIIFLLHQRKERE